MKGYLQLTSEDRIYIEVWQSANKTQEHLTRCLGVHPGEIREMYVQQTIYFRLEVSSYRPTSQVALNLKKTSKCLWRFSELLVGHQPLG